MYTLPILPYEYYDLAPYISSDIMELHHKKHHQGYVDKLNAALENTPETIKNKPLVELVSDLSVIPEDARQAVRNNGGGHYNHSLFWESLAPSGKTAPASDLVAALEAKYGSFDAFKDAFTKEALGLFGSGWVWLLPDLSIITTPNQDTPMMHGMPEPIFGLDVWEHAYYLDYKNVRADYVKAWWSVVNWDTVLDRYRQLAPQVAVAEVSA